MHICLVNFEYPKETTVGGIGLYQKRNAEMLKEFGHDVTVIAGAIEKDQDYIENGIRVIRLKKGNDPFDSVENCYKYRVRIDETIKKVNAERKIDVVEIPDLGAEGIIFQQNKDRDIPIVVKLHTPTTMITEFNGGATTFKPDVQKQLADWEEEFINNADSLISCSALLREMINERFPRTKHKDIKVVYNVAEFDQFYPTHNNHNSKTIIYCGTIEQRKGVLVLAKAIPLVIDKLKDEDIRFNFVGQDLYRNDKLILTSEYILSIIPEQYHKYVNFVGYIPNDKLNESFNEARFAILPSLFDNLPYVALEELATEMPIIASNNTGIREMIINEESGILYNPNDYQILAEKIIYLYNNTNVAKEYGRKGRISIENQFSPEIIIKQMEKVYKDVINEYKNRKTN